MNPCLKSNGIHLQMWIGQRIAGVIIFPQPRRQLENGANATLFRTLLGPPQSDEPGRQRDGIINYYCNSASPIDQSEICWFICNQVLIIGKAISESWGSNVNY